MEYNTNTRRWKMNATEQAALVRVLSMLDALKRLGESGSVEATEFLREAFDNVERPNAKKPNQSNLRGTAQ